MHMYANMNALHDIVRGNRGARSNGRDTTERLDRAAANAGVVSRGVGKIGKSHLLLLFFLSLLCLYLLEYIVPYIFCLIRLMNL